MLLHVVPWGWGQHPLTPTLAGVDFGAPGRSLARVGTSLPSGLCFWGLGGTLVPACSPSLAPELSKGRPAPALHSPVFRDKCSSFPFMHPDEPAVTVPLGHGLPENQDLILLRGPPPAWPP